MIAKGLFNTDATGFYPVDKRARELFSRLSRRGHRDRPVFMTVRTARNPEFSALAHLIIGRIASAIGVPLDAVKQYLKERTGRYDVVRMPTGKTLYLYHSTAFEAMSNEDFAAFWHDAMPIITEELLGGVKSRERDEIIDIIAGKVPYGAD